MMVIMNSRRGSRIGSASRRLSVAQDKGDYCTSSVCGVGRIQGDEVYAPESRGGLIPIHHGVAGRETTKDVLRKEVFPSSADEP